MSVQYNYVHFYTIAIVVLLYHTIYTTQSVEHLKTTLMHMDMGKSSSCMMQNQFDSVINNINDRLDILEKRNPIKKRSPMGKQGPAREQGQMGEQGPDIEHEKIDIGIDRANKEAVEAAKAIEVAEFNRAVEEANHAIEAAEQLPN